MVHRRVVVVQGCRRVYIGSDPCCGVLRARFEEKPCARRRALQMKSAFFLKLERICQKDIFKIKTKK
jgi:hypothetical protein